MRFLTSFYRTIRPSLRFIFHPNPGIATYTTPSMEVLIAFCVALIVLSFAIRVWRRGISNPVTKKLSRSWSAFCFWFGVSGLVLVVCRVEQIQFLAMRFLWVLWILGALVYLYFQARQFRARHYRILPKEPTFDPRDRYLPGKRK